MKEINNNQDQIDKDEKQIMDDLTKFISIEGTPEQIYAERVKFCGSISKARVIKLRELINFLWIYYKSDDDVFKNYLFDISKIVYSNKSDFDKYINQSTDEEDEKEDEDEKDED